MKRILIFSFALLIITGCKNNRTFILEGSLKDSRQEQIYLSRIDINVPVIVDSSKISGKGTFRFRIESTEPDFYQLGLSQTNYANLLAEPGEKIRIDFADTNLYRNYSVTGSKGSELLQILDLKLIETKQQLDSVSALYIKASARPDFAEKGPVIEEEYLKIAREQRNFNIAFILENMRSLSSIKALYQEIEEGTYVLFEPRDLQYLKIVSDSLKKYYPESKHTKALVSNFEKELNEFNARRLQAATSDMPETILDPDLKDING